MKLLANKYDFVILYDVKNGNPNGDPDAANMPRQIIETRKGVVTDGAIKRKIRNYIDLRYAGEEGMGIFIQHGIPKDFEQDKALKDVPKPSKKGFLEKNSYEKQLKKWMCDKFWDVRTFGAVCQRFTDKDAGNVDGSITGPVQISFSESISPISIQRIGITSCAVANAKEAETKNNTMGTKYITPYGLYKATGHVSPHLAEKTGFDEKDLEKLWDAILHMFETDHAAGRGDMAVRKLVIFKHAGIWGNAFEEDLEKVVSVAKKADMPMGYEDYDVTIDKEAAPDGIEVIIKK